MYAAAISPFESHNVDLRTTNICMKYAVLFFVGFSMVHQRQLRIGIDRWTASKRSENGRDGKRDANNCAIIFAFLPPIFHVLPFLYALIFFLLYSMKCHHFCNELFHSCSFSSSLSLILLLSVPFVSYSVSLDLLARLISSCRFIRSIHYFSHSHDKYN